MVKLYELKKYLSLSLLSIEKGSRFHFWTISIRPKFIFWFLQLYVSDVVW